MRPAFTRRASRPAVRFRGLFARPLVGCAVAAGTLAGSAMLAVPAAAQTEALRTFSLDSRYVVRTYSNDGLAHFGIEVLDLATWPAEAIGLDGAGGNIARGLAVLIGPGIIGQALGLSYHELGHGTRVAAAGYRPSYGFGTLATDAEVQAALASGELNQSFFGYFLSSFFEGSGYTLATPEDVLFGPIGDAELTASGWDLVVAAGGLNNEMLFAERLEDRIHRGGGHVGMLGSYVKGKLSAVQYADGSGLLGDVRNALDAYAAMGIDVDRGDIDDASTMSLLLSATSYQLAYRLIRVFAGDPIRFQPWTPYGIELPNTSLFLTRAGLSFRVRTGYRRGRWRFPVAVEHVFDGRSRTEVTVGGEWSVTPEWRVAPLLLGARVTVGEQLSAAVTASRRLGERFLVTGGYALYDSRNLLGERMTPSLESGPRYHDVFLRLGVVY